MAIGEDATALFEIRAILCKNENRMGTDEKFSRVIRVPGNNACNSVPFYAAMTVIHHCHQSSTKLDPKVGGRWLKPRQIEIYIFSPATVCRHGFTQGNTGATPIWEWNEKSPYTLRQWGANFLSFVIGDDKKISSLSYPEEPE